MEEGKHLGEGNSWYEVVRQHGMCDSIYMKRPKGNAQTHRLVVVRVGSVGSDCLVGTGFLLG